MDEARLVHISKFLSKHLRHQPERIGLTLDPGGWVSVDELLAACARAGLLLTRAELDEVVARNDKARFSYDASGKLIRANQGHSVEVDLDLEPVAPPAVLYHGTGAGEVEAFVREDLKRMRRHHVPLAPDGATAEIVGRRQGPPVIFAVDAAAMARDGYPFYRAKNGVWLVAAVPPRYLQLAMP